MWRSKLNSLMYDRIQVAYPFSAKWKFSFVLMLRATLTFYIFPSNTMATLKILQKKKTAYYVKKINFKDWQKKTCEIHRMCSIVVCSVLTDTENPGSITEIIIFYQYNIILMLFRELSKAFFYSLVYMKNLFAMLWRMYIFNIGFAKTGQWFIPLL